MNDREPDTGPTRHLGADLIIPVLGLGFAVYYVSTIWGLRWQASAIGFSLSGALALIGAILGLRFWRQYRSGEADLGFGQMFGETPVVVLRRLGLIALTCGFVFSMPYLGFTISLFLFVLLTVLLLAGWARIGTALLLASGMSLFGYLLFIVLVRARFPHGPFERAVELLVQG